MAGSPGTRLAPDLPARPRAALVVATTRHEDPELRQLRAPAHDAEDLAEILGDPGIGAFTVTQVIDADERQVRRAIDVFLSGRGVGDLVVVYLSCHGLLDRRNRLYFAASDTIKTQLGSTGIPAVWLMDELEECRARSKVLVLDCCFSGAFSHGSKGEADLDLERRLGGHGRGQAVLTASRAGEYSFEGEALPGAASAGSVFTAGLVKGLRTGAADVGGDGYVSVDEAFDYAYSHVLSSGASQTPQRWLYGGEGAIMLARSPAGIAVTPAPLPETLAAGLDSPHPYIRIGAVNVLGELLSGADAGLAFTAEQKLRQIADTEVPAVAAAARGFLSSTEPVGAERNEQESPSAKPSTPPSIPRPAVAESVHGDEKWRQAGRQAEQQARRVTETQAPPARRADAQRRTDIERAPEAAKHETGTAASPVNRPIVAVYDPAQARVEAESVKAIMAKYQHNTDPEFRMRALRIKEQRSELVKQHLWVLWTDYFKPQHFQKYPQLHQLFNEATKLAGAAGTKGSTDIATADELLAKIEEINLIFWKTKQI